MLRRRAGLAEGDDEATTRVRIADTVATWIPDERDRAWVEPALLTLLGLEPASHSGRDVLFAAWRIFFERIAARSTTVLVFEDLQWADDITLEAVGELARFSRELPLLILGVYRRDETPPGPRCATGDPGC